MRTVVIGAGPAGCVAAVALAGAGVDVTLIDEHQTAGGHLRYDAAGGPSGWQDELEATIGSSGVHVLPSSVAWAAFRVAAGVEVMVTGPAGAGSLLCDRLVLAPGTTDRELLVEGTTLPGVMTERAVRILFNLHGVLPGERIAIVGDDLARTGRLRDEFQASGLATTVLDVKSVGRIVGTEGVEAVETVDRGTLPVDVVVLALGERPDTQLAGMLDVPRSFSPESDAWVAPALDCGNGIYCIGGALRGMADEADLVRDGLDVAGLISGTRLTLPGLMEITADVLGQRVVR
ncbi:MAG: NAD(P)/FAD-dependent oxidoreductase [Chloroflexota bacterium]|nr:NAD(P)/FAD-dependent oxidoreductase [Chloroflexota bacterium]